VAAVILVLAGLLLVGLAWLLYVGAFA